MNLRPEYFEQIYTEDYNGVRYRSMRPKGNPMILFSKVDGSPLAALHLRCQYDNQGHALITKRTYNSAFLCDFQGLIDKDDQEFELVITNLNSDGHINFNILKKNMAVDEVNPGGLNEINELRPYESYAVRCDQADNRTLILSSIKEVVKTASGEKTVKVTVEDAEAKSSEPVGTYYYLSVVPQLDKPLLVERFTDTIWACVDTFITSEKIPVRAISTISADTLDRSYASYPTRSMDTRDIRYTSYATRSTDTLRNHTYPTTYVNQPVGGSIGSRTLFESVSRRADEKCAISTNNLSDNFFAGDDYESSDSECKDIEPAGDDLSGSDWLDEEVEACDDSEDDMDLFGGKSSKAVIPDIIKDSYSSKVTGGKYIEVKSYATNIDYSYETSSVPCVICLSVSDKLVLLPEPDKSTFIEESKQMIVDMIKSKGVKLLEKLTTVYKSGECVICLEDGVDLIYYQCGHQCCHYACHTVDGSSMENCPLCRNRIGALIRV